MKKNIAVIALLAFGFLAKAQDGGSDKNFRFGLKLSPSLNWYKVDDKKTFEKEGIVPKFGYGLITEFKLTDVAWFSTGLQVDYDGGKIKMLDTVGYYYSEDDGFLEVNDIDFADTNSTKGYIGYQLNNRKYRTTYLSIPLQLRLKTKEIGYMTYFGNFGFLASFQLKTRANDNVTYYDLNTGNNKTEDIEDLEISKDMNLIRLGLDIGGGAEMNISGSTSLIFGLNFHQGFTNAVKKESKFNIDGEKTNDALSSGSSTKPVAQEQKFLTQHLTLFVGILF